MRVHYPVFAVSAVLLAFCSMTAHAPRAMAGGAPRDTIDAGDCVITSSVDCFLRADGAGGASTQAAANKGTISPSGRGPGEDIHVLVTVRNVLGAALPGATVVATATAMGGAVFRWDDGSLPPGDTAENPQTGVSDSAGQVEMIFDEAGVALPPSPTMPDLDFAVTQQGPGPGAPVFLNPCTTKFSMLSPDMNADGRVDAQDFGLFARDFVEGNARSDFNWDGSVNGVDFGMFAAHYLQSLDGQ